MKCGVAKKLSIMAAMLLVGVFSACGASTGSGSGTEAAADGSAVVEWGNWGRGTGVIGLLPKVLDEHPEWQKANSIQLDLKQYSSLKSLYAEMAQGKIAGMSGPATAAGWTVQGGPVKMIGGLAPSSVNVLSKGKKWSKENLEGSSLSAMTSTSTWKLLKAWIAESWGLQADEDYKVLPAPDNAGAVSQVAAGTAVFGMAWQPHAMLGVKKFDDVEVVASPKELVPGDRVSWQFATIVPDGMSGETASNLNAALKKAAQWMEEHPSKVDAMTVERGKDPGVSEAALTEGVVKFDVQPMSESLRKQVEADYQMLVDSGTLSELPDDSFYAD